MLGIEPIEKLCIIIKKTLAEIVSFGGGGGVGIRGLVPRRYD